MRKAGRRGRLDLSDNAKVIRSEGALLDRFKSHFTQRRATAIEATVCASLSALERAKVMATLNEEATTAALIGALMGTQPTCEVLFEPQAQGGRALTLDWSDYVAAEKDEHWGTESGTGADFSIVVWTSANKGRLAMFQAKRTEPGKGPVGILSSPDRTTPQKLGEVAFQECEAFLDVHRRPPQRNQPIALWRLPQMIQLSRTGRDILRIKSLSGLPGQSPAAMAKVFSVYREPAPPLPEGVTARPDATPGELAKGVGFARLSMPATKARAARVRFQAAIGDWNLRTRAAYRSILALEKQAISTLKWVRPIVADLSWVHYVAYLRHPVKSQPRSDSDGAVTVALSELGSAHHIESAAKASSPNLVDLTDVSCRSFSHLLLAGVLDTSRSRKGWLDVDRALVEAVLPVLRSHGRVINLRTRRGWRLELGVRNRVDELRKMAADEPRNRGGKHLPGFGPQVASTVAPHASVLPDSTESPVAAAARTRLSPAPEAEKGDRSKSARLGQQSTDGGGGGAHTPVVVVGRAVPDQPDTGVDSPLVLPEPKDEGERRKRRRSRNGLPVFLLPPKPKGPDDKK
jgi:hypothetical protein